MKTKELPAIDISGNSIPGAPVPYYLTCIRGEFFAETKYNYIPTDDPGEGIRKIIVTPPLVLAGSLADAEAWISKRILETLLERNEIAVGEYAFGGDYYEWRS